ncbi:MAG: histidine--tRNA ligase [Gammaproteobacteria bacterium]
MSNRIEPIRGMNDILPDQSSDWQFVEKCIRELLGSYGYGEIRLPLLEKTELFARSIGETTDIVEKQMYTFDDRSGNSLTLRPEATASIVRAGITHGLFHNRQQRLWCMGPMFRYERPQKGRYRQFHQVDVEAIGYEGPDIDAEIIFLSARLWRRLGLNDVRLTINSLGTPESRKTYRTALVDYFSRHSDQFDEHSRRRLEDNPLRILDSKDPGMQELIEKAPAITDTLDPDSAEHFNRLCGLLDDVGIAYTIDPRLVRGLDYYTRTVFEWVTDRLGAQDAVCSGGRYDGLVGQLGGRPTPAIGWALGLERLVALLSDTGNMPPGPRPHAYLVAAGDSAPRAAMLLAELLRDRLPGLRLMVNCDGGSFKSQLKRADRSEAEFAVVLGDEEAVARKAGLKPLRTDGSQEELGWDDLAARLEQLIA